MQMNHLKVGFWAASQYVLSEAITIRLIEILRLLITIGRVKFKEINCFHYQK
jgi:hypothetical protein